MLLSYRWKFLFSLSFFRTCSTRFTNGAAINISDQLFAMTPHLLKVLPNHDHSFSIRQDVVPHFFNKWHYHPEVELVHIVKGTGTQFIGDNIQRFNSGDVILVGANLPHFWRSDEIYFAKDSALEAEAVVAHFREDFWGRDFLNLQENIKIKDLLEKAKKGLLIQGETRKIIVRLLNKMLQAEGTHRIILLLQGLCQIAKGRDYVALSKTDFTCTQESKEAERINAIYNYSMEHFRDNISLKTISSVANMSSNSFCRYFKTRTKKSYSTFLQELRVGNATRLLIDNRQTITQVCYECGFNNITNFYKIFKKITGKTPLEYRRKFVES